MKTTIKICIIGGGNIGLLFGKSLIQSGIVDTQNLLIIEKEPRQIAYIKQLEMGKVQNHYEKIENYDVIILAVKPQDAAEMFTELLPHLHSQQIILSFMAGIKIQTIQDKLRLDRIFRAMPNLPSLLGEGMIVYTQSKNIPKIETYYIENLLSTTGKTLFVENEDLIDAATAISGSGPAYVFYFLNALVEAAQKMGFSQKEAELLVFQTFLGSIHLYQNHNLNFEEWINKVASKGGTTEAALNHFQQTHMSENIVEGTMKALKRAYELSNVDL